MSFPRYPKYKDSGVEWLGEVPGHWAVDRIKWSTTCCRNGIWGGEAQQDDGDIPCVRVADFDRERLRVELDEPTIRNVPEKDRCGRQLHQGDLLLEKSGGGENQPVGCVVLYDDPTPAVCSNFVARLAVAEEMDSSFWRYVHAAAYAVRLNTRSIKQTSGIQNLDSSQYFDERSAFPPLPEQIAIAAFLDRETAKIDGLVAEQRRLMALLKEKRQAVISHAVTKGLNPDAPMKPSGIEWLGDVPEHWEVLPLRRIVSKFVDYRGKTPTRSDSGIPLVTASAVRDGKVDHSRSPCYITQETYDKWMVRGLPAVGDVVFTTEGATFGETGRIVDASVALAQRLIMLKADRDKISDGFLYYIFLSDFGRAEQWSNTTGTTVFGIKASKLKAIIVIAPALKEQNKICRHIESETNPFEEAIVEAQRAIDLLQERRTALISAAVTGQIDVRQLSKEETA